MDIDTIFVVDDSATNLIIVSEMLKNQYKILTMPSAEAMFRLIQRIKPKIILLDIEMPDIDGYKAIQLLKEDDEYKNIPVIFITGNHDEDTKIKCLSLGAKEVVTKPFEKQRLIESIKRNII